LSRDDFSFSSSAGRYLALCFIGTSGDEIGRRTLDLIRQSSAVFDGIHAGFFGISVDPKDEIERRIIDETSMVFFLDFDAKVSRLYGAAPRNFTGVPPKQYRRMWVILDPTLRVMAIFPIADVEKVLEFLQGLPPPDRFAGVELQAPILYLPNVFEP